MGFVTLRRSNLDSNDNKRCVTNQVNEYISFLSGLRYNKKLQSELVLEDIERRFGGKGWEKVIADREAFMKGMSLVAK